ncbi:hypothetical protein HBB16_17630 [Pseudonocardia sp. MCCB 268]|nr:hypothetical protein [Pseudonocardia cytotoxica]
MREARLPPGSSCRTAGGLSACGARFSEHHPGVLGPPGRRHQPAFDFDGVEAVLAEAAPSGWDAVVGLQARGYASPGCSWRSRRATSSRTGRSRLSCRRPGSPRPRTWDALVTAFHDEHERLFMVATPTRPSNASSGGCG